MGSSDVERVLSDRYQPHGAWVQGIVVGPTTTCSVCGGKFAGSYRVEKCLAPDGHVFAIDNGTTQEELPIDLKDVPF